MYCIRIPLLIIFTCILVQGCSSVRTGTVPVEDRSKTAVVEDIEQKGGPGMLSAPGGKPGRSGGVSESGQSPPAVVALLEEARSAAAEGEYESASAALERAIRIDSKNAIPWNRLARMRLAQGKLQQALTLARRSNSLATGNYSLQQENWQLILQVKEKVRDVRGIEEARRKIEQLKNMGAGS